MPDAPPPGDPTSERGADEPSAQLSAVPFLIAFALFVLVAGWAFLNLRDDAGLVLLAPDGFEVIDDDTFRVVGERPGGECAELRRVQVDMAKDRIYTEMVIAPADDCIAPTIIATVTLPQSIADRRLVPGAGRFPLPCERVGASDGWICTDR